MVAFAGSDPVGVLIGAKRPHATLVHRIAVHPDHQRQGHGRHLLDSLGSKLAILGPPRIVAEVPETFSSACGLFCASGYVQEAVLTDHILQCDEIAAIPDDRSGRFVIPVTVDDLAANGLLGDDHPQTSWERSVETLTARKHEIGGLAVTSGERIESYVLHHGAEIVCLRSLSGDGGTCLHRLLVQLRSTGVEAFRFPRVHPSEISGDLLAALGFRATAVHRLFAARARPG
jgi:hypothetical protein